MQNPLLSADLPAPAIDADASGMLLLAVGGGASAVLPRILADWPSPPDAAAIDTDRLALDSAPGLRTCPIGADITREHSAAGDPAIGRRAAQADADRIRDLFAGHSVLVLLACLGGGTASGAAPYVAKLAREAGLLVLAFATTPFDFEGPRRTDCAQAAIADLRNSADILVRLPNQSLHAILPPDTPLADAFSYVNRMLTAAIRGLWTLLARENLLNIDIADIQALVENSANECRFAYAEASGPARAETAIRALLEGPMLDRGRQLANAGSVLVAVSADAALTLAELNAIHNAVRSHARANAHVILGAAILDDWSGPLAIALYAADNAPTPFAAPRADDFSATAAPAAPTGKSKPRRHVKSANQPTLFSSDASPDTPPPADEGAFPSLDTLKVPAYQRQGLRFSP